MEKRFAAFLAIAFALLMANALLMQVLNPPLPRPDQPVAALDREDQVDKIGKEIGEQAEPADNRNNPDVQQPADTDAQPPDETDPAADEQPAAPIEQKKVPLTYYTLGSVDPGPNNPYRMLVTFTNQGAAIERIELAQRRYRDLDDRRGYLGHLSPVVALDGRGCLIRVVGPGTPAGAAGLQADDVITAIDGVAVSGPDRLQEILASKRPKDEVKLELRRPGKGKLTLPVVLGRRPLEVIRPEHENVRARGEEAPSEFPSPPSLLLTLQKLGGQSLQDGDEAAANTELEGVELLSATWELAEQNETTLAFRRVVGDGIEVVKRFQLVEIPSDERLDANYPAYHLFVDLEFRNQTGEAKRLAYRLDGPNGLPIEGWWYGSKIGRTTFGAVGVRDMYGWWEGQNEPILFGASSIAAGDVAPQKHHPVVHIGVDAQYISSVLLPQKNDLKQIWIAETRAIQLGPLVPDEKHAQRLANVTCRLISEDADIEPGKVLRHRFTLFAGPKKPDLLAQYHPPQEPRYNLGELVYYGWFGPVAKLMLWVLHAFYTVVGNYGLSIIMLTVVVRGLMFPLSRKQAQNMAKMQELAPEMKRLQEKYKDLQKRAQAQQELYRKHNVRPLGGCLIMFLQLPIFIGLYRSLMVDIELRQAPMISESIRWASDLAAPDMLFDWTGFMPELITHSTGMLGLGPYFNVLPLVTVALFLTQQKMFMPPPADEQAALQQKVMTFMMIFIGVMFYKVASGLCLYFIASTLWGIAERKLLPKPAPKNDESGSVKETTRPVKASTNGNPSASAKKKAKRRR